MVSACTEIDPDHIFYPDSDLRYPLSESPFPPTWLNGFRKQAVEHRFTKKI